MSNKIERPTNEGCVIPAAYVTLVKNFFHNGATECACAPDIRDHIALFYDFNEALENFKSYIPQLTTMGYHLTNSWTGGEESPLCYGCRYQMENGRAIVFEIARKEIQGMPKGWHDII